MGRLKKGFQVKRTGIQLCYPFEEKRLLTWSPPYIVQPKLDGLRCRAILQPSEPFPSSVILLSSEENFFLSVPHLLEPLHNLALLSEPLELDGELYNHSYSFEEIDSIASRSVNLHPDHLSLQFHIFDLVQENLPQWERLRRLTELKALTKSPDLHFVQSIVVETLDGVLKAYDRILEEGYEGIIIRNVDATYIRRRSTLVMKFKPKKQDEYPIVGFTQMVDKNGLPKEMLGSLVCSSDEGTTFGVGSGMTEEFRYEWWPAEKAQLLVGKTAVIKYQHITSTGRVPRFPVFVEVVDSKVFNPLL